MRNQCRTSSFLPLMLLAAGVLVAAPGVWAKPPICDRDKPNQYDPECVCPKQFREFSITGRLPTDPAEGSAVSVYPQGGAEYVICMPPSPSWNGGMVYASMGTVKLDPNEKEGTIVTVAGQRWRTTFRLVQSGGLRIRGGGAAAATVGPVTRGGS